MPELAESILSSGPVELREIIRTTPVPPLDAGNLFTPLADWLSETADLAMPPAQNELAKLCCESGLWLLAGDLDRCHSICQDLKITEGKYWHALMHRREGDFWNAKYWFRQIPAHSVYQQLTDASTHQFDKLAINSKGTWDAQKFVDITEQAVKKGTLKDTCKQLCWIEHQTLLEHCWRLAWPT